MVMEKEELGHGDRNQKAGEGKISFKHELGKFLSAISVVTRN